MTETLASTSSSTASGGTPPVETAWINAYERLSPRWQSSALSPQSAIPIAISRVNQVDAGRLDIEMSAMLKEQMVKVFSVMKPGLLFQYEAELDAFLEFLIWRFSIWVDKPTPGNALMNLRYRDERATDMRGKIRTGLEGPGLTVYQKLWYCVATVGGQYIWTRLQSFSAFRQWGDSEQRSLARRAWLIVQRIEGVYKAASFTNLLVFLFTGRYRNLIERALQARLVYGSPHMNRAVSFEYMNRQLVWNEFSEMLLLLLPLLNSSTMKNFLSPFSKSKSSGSDGDETLCPICQANPTTVYLALPCQHRLQSELMDLLMSGESGISAFPADDNMFCWRGTISGSKDTVFEGTEYKLSLSFPTDYPFKPPKVKFETACFHPNVDVFGNICLDILQDKWSSAYDVRSVLISIQSLLGEPNTSSPLNTQAAALWSNQEEYRKMVEKLYKPIE